MKNNEFKYLLIGVLILAWGVITYQRNQKRKTERAEILDDLNNYVNGWIKYASIQKAIVRNGKGRWISKEEFEKQPENIKQCSLDEKCLWNKNNFGYVGKIVFNPAIIQNFMFAGVDTNERFPPTIDDIKNAKVVLIGVTEGASFNAELNKYPGRSLDELWKQVNKNHFYLNRLKYLEKNPSITGKMFPKSVLRSIAKNYTNLEMNKATEILLNVKKIQDFPG